MNWTEVPSCWMTLLKKRLPSHWVSSIKWMSRNFKALFSKVKGWGIVDQWLFGRLRACSAKDNDASLITRPDDQSQQSFRLKWWCLLSAKPAIDLSYPYNMVIIDPVALNLLEGYVIFDPWLHNNQTQLVDELGSISKIYFANKQSISLILDSVFKTCYLKLNFTISAHLIDFVNTSSLSTKVKYSQ